MINQWDQDGLLLHKWKQTGLLNGVPQSKKLVLAKTLEYQRKFNDNNKARISAAIRRISIPVIRWVFDGLLKNGVDIEISENCQSCFQVPEPVNDIAVNIYKNMLTNNVPIGLDAEVEVTIQMTEAIVNELKKYKKLTLGYFTHTPDFVYITFGEMK